jgi:CPA2 family monovalent cation:H+ antiporter-2
VSTALTISVSLAQIGEFSFILADWLAGVIAGGRTHLILAGAILSIMINPLLFFALDRLGHASRLANYLALRRRGPCPSSRSRLRGHTVLVGWPGRKPIGRALKERGVPSS